MARVEFDIETSVTPERVLEGLTDFTERRPDIWPGLKREMYEVHEVGDTWADVTEGTGGSVWARERYDWASPGKVTWTVQESGFCAPGSFISADVTPRDGGSRIHITWERTPTTLLGRMIAVLIVLTRGAALRGSYVKGLRNLETA
ncbi:MAG: SRPBCC family protein [Actinomycetota bacterium]